MTVKETAPRELARKIGCNFAIVGELPLRLWYRHARLHGSAAGPMASMVTAVRRATLILTIYPPISTGSLWGLVER
jgi:hypothetical protein